MLDELLRCGGVQCTVTVMEQWGAQLPPIAGPMCPAHVPPLTDPCALWQVSGSWCCSRLWLGPGSTPPTAVQCSRQASHRWRLGHWQRMRLAMCSWVWVSSVLAGHCPGAERRVCGEYPTQSELKGPSSSLGHTQVLRELARMAADVASEVVEGHGSACSEEAA